MLAIRGAFILLVLAPLVYGVYYPQPYLNQILRKIPIAVVDNDLSELSRRIVADAWTRAAPSGGGPRRHACRSARGARPRRGLRRGRHPARDRARRAQGHDRPHSGLRRCHLPVHLQNDCAAASRSRSIRCRPSSPPAARAPTAAWSRRRSPSASPADILLQPIFNPVGGYASYIVPAAFVLILQQTAADRRGDADGGRAGAGRRWSVRERARPRHRAPDHLFAGARALSSSCCRASTAFPRSASPLQLFALASLFILATSFMGQAVGAWFKHPETPTLIFLGTSLPQFFLTGFSWPREAIPEPVQAAGYIFPSDFAIDGIVRIDQLGASLWEVARDWRGLWCLAVIYFALAVMSRISGQAEAGRMASRSSDASSRSASSLVAAGVGGYLAVALRADAADRRRRARDRDPHRARGRRPARGHQGRRRATRVRAGDVVAELSALELTAAVGQARAALAAATADRDHVYAGVRAEQIASLAAEIAKAKSRAGIRGAAARPAPPPGAQRLPPRSRRSTRRKTTWRARVPTSPRPKPIMPPRVAGPTKEERAIADAQVEAAASALAVLERRLDKTILRAPADGVVSVIVAEVGENIRAGQPVLAIEETGKQWLSFNVREDLLHGLTVGTKVDVARRGRTRDDAGRRHRAAAARGVRDLAGRARGRRSRSQYAAPAPRSARRCDRARARHDGLAVALTGGMVRGCIGHCRACCARPMTSSTASSRPRALWARSGRNGRWSGSVRSAATPTKPT